jgi:hypothetical protein
MLSKNALPQIAAVGTFSAAAGRISGAALIMLNEVPTRGAPMPPTDPLIYRFYELVMEARSDLECPHVWTGLQRGYPSKSSSCQMLERFGWDPPN